jgi:L-ribulose-5-phosphate 4-epimerase
MSRGVIRALNRLKAEVCAANMALASRGLAVQTWGNASAVDRASGLVVIKPSGVPYDRLRPADMVVVEVDSGRIVQGRLKPSSDTPTHLALYRGFEEVGGIVHTHSFFATAWAQSGKPVPVLGTTHADHFHGPIPCTRLLTEAEIRGDYEVQTARVILEKFKRGRDPMACPAILVAGHGPFVWGRTVTDAVTTAEVLEQVIRLAGETLRNFPSTKPLAAALLKKHFERKHGPGAYYGQKAAGARNNRDRNR